MINILTGRQTDPLQEKILDEAIENYIQHPEEETFIIVPNHIKFTTEVKTISKLANIKKEAHTSVKNLQILSFSRLAWFFLKDQEQGLPAQLDDAAAAMLLSKIIAEHQHELLLFQDLSINSGMVKQIYDTILQVYEGNIDLTNFDEEKLDLETENKIHDLNIIYQDFIEKIAGKFATKNEVQLQLNEVLAKLDLSKTSFYFTDFSHFSLQETLTIKLLMLKAKQVNLGFKTKVGALDFNPESGEYDYVIQTTIQRLINFINQRNLTYKLEELPVAVKPSNKEKLNSIWIGLSEASQELKQVQLVKADSRYAEAYFVARTIYQQVALNHYRFKDFLILAPNLSEYETYLLPILRQNKIPYFNDLQQEMKYHPLVILIESLSELINNQLQTNNIIAILKTKLLIPDWYTDDESYLHDVDELENFVLAHGINHYLWRRPLEKFINSKVIRLDGQPQDIARLEKLRTYIVKKITSFCKEITEETDSKTAIRNFFEFLVNSGISKRLETWRDQDNERGDLQQAEQPEQLWDLLITLLQDYLLINPTEFDHTSFMEMLISAFREATFSQIPSTLDAVNISEIGMVQESGYKQVFIIGTTSNNLPSINKTPGFLSSENIAQLSSNFDDDAYLEDHQQLNNLDQEYQFGLALSLAEDRVYLTYPVINAANEQLEPSIFYQRLKQANASEFEQHDLPEDISELLSFLTNPDASLGYLTYLSSVDSSKKIKQLLAIVKKYLPKKTDAIIAASQFDNTPQSIGQELAQELYGTNLSSSVSQLETYYQNSYEYFLNYGLKLRRRAENGFDVIQAGNYFHETFDKLVKLLHQEKIDLASLSELELEQKLHQIRDAMKDEGQYAQLMEDPFNQYLFKCLDHTTSNVAYNWARTLKRTPFRPKYSELAFGAGAKLAGIKLPLSELEGNHQVELRGKIDRVDLAPYDNADKILGQVIDYKSSAKTFNLGMFYQGISLQMISYLDVLTKNQSFFVDDKQMSLLGAFYQTVTRKLEKLNSKSSVGADFTIKPQSMDGKAKLEYTGIISNDPEILAQAEPLLIKDHDNSKKLYSGFSITSKDKFSLSKESSFSEDEMLLLLEYDEFLIKEASKEILSGEIKLNPYKYGKNSTALTYSDYRDVFFFDAMLRQNRYHEIENLDKSTLLTKIKERLNKKEEQ